MSTTVPEAGSPRAPRLPNLLFGSLPLLAAAGPLITLSGGIFAFRILCALLILHAGLFLLGRSPWRGPDAWLFALTVVMVGSGLVGLATVRPQADNPYAEFLAMTLGLFTALTGRAWQRRFPSIYLSLARGWVVAGVVVSVVAAWEVATGLHLPGYVTGAGTEPAAGFGNPNGLAVFMVMANVWIITVREHSGAAWRAATWLLVLATGPVLVVTDGRLAMAMWLLLLLWTAWRAIRHNRTVFGRGAAAAVPIGAAVAVVVAVPQLASYFVEASTGGSSGGVRVVLSEQGLRFASELGGLPGGPGSFEAIMLERGDLVATGGLINAHNLWVEILVQYGLVSVLLFVAWMVASLVARSGHRAVIAPAVLTLVAMGLVDSSLLDDAQLWLFVLTLAMAVRVEPVITVTSATAASSATGPGRAPDPMASP